MTLAGQRAPSGSGAERGTGTKVTSDPKNGCRMFDLGARRCGIAVLRVSSLPAFTAPHSVRDFLERSKLPRGE